ncbi:hypothetical protein OPIT5_00990 [Opitutaceae bacterium TAV5]|nr:hypothetical protein OPIT5_00990 [Opitutaceae bacterium TAV5]
MLDPETPPLLAASEKAERFDQEPVYHVSRDEAPFLVVRLRFGSPGSAAWRLWEFRLHPDIAGSLLRITGPEIEAALAAPNAEKMGALRIKPNGQMFLAMPEAPVALPLAALASPHLVVREVRFYDQTDHHSNLLDEREYLLHPGERCLPLTGNLVCIENNATGSGKQGRGREGFLMLLLAPLHRVRAEWSPVFDFLFAWQDRMLVMSACPAGYSLARLAYTGGRAGATRALHGLQRILCGAGPGENALVLSNTWGDRAGAAHLGEQFILDEITAARDLGVEVVQIDDGWQRGATVNTAGDNPEANAVALSQNGAKPPAGVWNGFWAADPNFWEPHPVRFPRGFAPLIEAADKAGVRLGLWYAPDSSDDLANRERDAAQILRLWREYGIAHFKLDAVKLHSRLAEQRFHALCDRLWQESGDAIVIDFDATAEHRPTYWGRLHGGPVFLQNRFTDNATWHPHQTLRALWTLAHYVFPPRLRIEFLNPARCEDAYVLRNTGEPDPLRPAAWPPEYLFAITMPASPLAWFENSKVPAAVADRWRPLIATWKQHRRAFHSGNIFPVGDAPNGFSWTGFVSVVPDGTFYFLIFRECVPTGTAVFRLPSSCVRLPGSATPRIAETLAGEGTVELDSTKTFIARIGHERRFLFARWRTGET